MEKSATVRRAACLLFTVSAVACLAGKLTGGILLVRWSKPLIVPCLAVTCFLLMKEHRVKGGCFTAIILALASGFVGDVLLMFGGDGFFLSGLLAFLAGHVFYYCALPSPWAGASGLERILSAVLLALLLSGAVLLAAGFKVGGILGIFVVLYACAFAFLLHSSIVAAVRCRSLLYLCVALGFILFAVSDLLIAAGRFSHLDLPGRSFWTMLAYIAAQSVVSLSLSRIEIRLMSTEYGRRALLLDDLRLALRRNEKAVCEAFEQDFGKGEFETYTTEIGFVHNAIRHTLRHLRRWMAPESVPTPPVLWPGQSRIVFEPYGKVLIIGPFNYPLHLVLSPLVAALAAGNTAVVRPSRQTPRVSGVLTEMLRETFPGEVVETVGPEVSNEELLGRRFDYIFFTGSPRVGKIVMEAASKHLTPVTLELGGKSPAIVCADAPVRLACERIAKGKFLNAGQTCVAPDYVLVHRSRHSEFISTMKAVVREYFGDTSSRPAEMTLMAGKRHWERVFSLIDREKVVIGGCGDAETCYISPTVMDNCSWDDPVMQEEIFGPLLPVIVYDDLERDVIAKVRSGEKPLSLYIFSRSGREIRAVLSGISFGGGCVNDTVMHLGNENLPFGGVGNSGMGSYHGKAGFLTFSHRKSILLKSSWLNFDILKPPYGHKLSFIRKIYR